MKRITLVCLIVLISFQVFACNQIPEATAINQVSSTNTQPPLDSVKTPSPKPPPTQTTTATPDPLAKYEADCSHCFVDGSEPNMPIWDNDQHGYIPQRNDTREQIIIDETFSVDIGEEVIWDEKIIWVRPNQKNDVEVYGKLIIRNSLVLWEQTHHMQTQLRVMNGGILDIESSYVFGANQYFVNWTYEDGAIVIFDNFIGDPWTVNEGSLDYTAVNYSSVRLTFVNDTYNANVIVSDAHHVWFEINPPAGSYEITFPAKREWIDWDISNIWPNSSIKVNHSYLYERDITLSTDTHVTIRDTPSGFGLGWTIYNFSDKMIECELRDLGDPDEDKGVFYDYQVWDLPCINSSLTVINSRLLRAWPMISGYIHLQVYNSNLVDVRIFIGPAIFEIYNSTVDRVDASEGGRFYLENTRIRYDIEIKGANSVVYGYGVVARDTDREIEIIEVNGGRYIELDNPDPPWE